MTHRLVIDAHIFEQFPDYQALILYGEEMKNFPSTQESIALLRSAEQECRNMFTLETLAQHPHIASWRDAYRCCGRTHCKIDGLLLPLLSLVGLLNLVGVTSFGWMVYAGAFWIILLLSFVPEFFGRMYLTT